jgi:KDO2-lipid IV(A) lauroyltransferase
MHQTVARLLYWLAAAFARLPWAWLRTLADALAGLWRRQDAREARVARRNLELIAPDWPAPRREALLREVLRSTTRQLFETLRLWTRPHAHNMRMIRQEHGVAAFDAAIAAGRGVIVAAPHHGNWELLNQWLAAHTPLAILYRPPDSKVGEAFLRIVRADRDRVTQVRADGRGVRELFRILKAGGVVGILPDQQPRSGGDGVLAPFFGLPTYTMTLLGRLAERSGAEVVFAWCERIDDDLGFALHVEPAPAGIADRDAVASATVLNGAVEAIARRDLAQYQWTYKRFRLKPSRDQAENPYRDLRS